MSGIDEDHLMEWTGSRQGGKEKRGSQSDTGEKSVYRVPARDQITGLR
jgi:hypothetical protein